MTEDWSTVRPARERTGATNASSKGSAASRGQARASAPAVIEPPDTLEMRSRRSSQPASRRRQITPTWNSIARYPPPDRQSAMPSCGSSALMAATLRGGPGGEGEVPAQPLQRPRAGRADAADRHAERRADRLVAGGRPGVQPAQE